MDDRNFDSLTRALAKGASRRSVIKGLLGLGSAALAGSVALDGDVEARRRSKPTPKPRSCPGAQHWDGSACACPEGLSQCNPGSGPTCCNDQGDVGPGYSECCDNACCQYPNQCVDGELCCPRLPEMGCLDNRGHCCQTLCMETSGEPYCCPPPNVCGNECCGDGTSCCTVDGERHCIPDGACCKDGQCGYLDDPQHCLEGICQRTGGTFAGTCDTRSTCDPDSICVDGACNPNLPPPNTSTGENVSVPLEDGSVSFPNVTSPGVTTITPASGSSAPVPGEFSTDSATFYDVHTTAEFSGTVTVCLSYDPGSYSNPAQVRLLHFENGSWVDITTSVGSSSVCGNVSSFSPFAIVEPVPAECEYDFQCPSDSANCRMNFCDNGVCSYKQANPGMLCAECSECNANGECVQTCGQDEICCGQGLDTGFSGCCTADRCNQNTGVCCDPGYSTCGPTCCRADQFCCGTACNDSPCCTADADCPACHQCNNGFCEPLCDQYSEQCCPDLDEHGRCVAYNQSCSGPICDTNLCQELQNGTCTDVCPAHDMICDGQGSCIACTPADGACVSDNTCCGDNVCCHGVCATLDSTCGGACCDADQDCCGGYYCVPKGARCCSGPAQCQDLNDCTGDGLKIWHNFTCPPSLGYCVESIEDCSNSDPCHPGMCAWDTGCWQDSLAGVSCGDQCCANCCNGVCIDESLTCCTSADDCPAVANQIAGCMNNICEYTSACPGCVGLWGNCDGLTGQSQTACDQCTPVICCYDPQGAFSYPRWTPASQSSNYICS